MAHVQYIKMCDQNAEHQELLRLYFVDHPNDPLELGRQHRLQQEAHIGFAAGALREYRVRALELGLVADRRNDQAGGVFVSNARHHGFEHHRITQRVRRRARLRQGGGVAALDQRHAEFAQDRGAVGFREHVVVHACKPRGGRACRGRQRQ
jgi:hypothetical protein